jgi:hypothetical protein
MLIFRGSFDFNINISNECELHYSDEISYKSEWYEDSNILNEKDDLTKSQN